MIYKLKYTKDYILILSDEEIKEGDYILWLDEYNNKIVKAIDTMYTSSSFSKIIAHLLLNGAPYLEGVPVLPPLKDVEDIEQLASDNCQAWEHYGTARGGFIRGYKLACEKYKFTEEDMFKMLIYGNSLSLLIKSGSVTDKPMGEIFKDFLQSIQQPKMPVGFECEIEPIPNSNWGFSLDEPKILGYKVNTITTHEGRVQWVGKYIYA